MVPPLLLLYRRRYLSARPLESKALSRRIFGNPADSVNDRIAWAMFEQDAKNCTLTPISVIIEPTSGNTGEGLAAVAAARGYRIITMPATMCLELRNFLQAYDAELILTPDSSGMKGTIQKVKALSADIETSFMPSQSCKSALSQSHYCTRNPSTYYW